VHSHCIGFSLTNRKYLSCVSVADLLKEERKDGNHQGLEFKMWEDVGRGWRERQWCYGPCCRYLKAVTKKMPPRP